jgi:hypothetical protein
VGRGEILSSLTSEHVASWLIAGGGKKRGVTTVLSMNFSLSAIRFA